LSTANTMVVAQAHAFDGEHWEEAFAVLRDEKEQELALQRTTSIAVSKPASVLEPRPALAATLAILRTDADRPAELTEAAAPRRGFGKRYRQVPKFWTFSSVCCACAEVTKKT
jgi:hypothetical protein